MTAEPVLTAEAVTDLFNHCLVNPEIPLPDGDACNVKGVLHTAELHPDRLEKRRDIIMAMLAELPDGFHEGLGGGWSFLNACNDRHGRQWTGFHLTMEKLFMLGMGLELVREVLPGMRETMPGGMPYYVVKVEVRAPA